MMKPRYLRASLDYCCKEDTRFVLDALHPQQFGPFTSDQSRWPPHDSGRTHVYIPAQNTTKNNPQKNPIKIPSDAGGLSSESTCFLL